mgnify:CR=1 FL=1
MYKAGFVSIFGKPNAGKSTLLNALLGEKLAITSHKSQTTRHRIKGFITTDQYQIVLSDMPGIIAPTYKLHEKMMQAVKNSLEDVDVPILLVDVRENLEDSHIIFSDLHLKVPSIVVLNKIDAVKLEQIKKHINFFNQQSYVSKVLPISALKHTHIDELLNTIVEFLPANPPFYEFNELTDMPTRFFVSELIREQVYHLTEKEIPYQTTILLKEFTEKNTLTKIVADIIVQRESQKGIILGERGSMIKKIGSAARIEIEKFLDRKVFLELFVKVRPHWRDNDLYLKEYGY